MYGIILGAVTEKSRRQCLLVLSKNIFNINGKNLSFYAKGYNLFNEAYADYAGASNGSYNTPAQSRRFIVGAEYKF